MIYYKLINRSWLVHIMISEAYFLPKIGSTKAIQCEMRCALRGFHVYQSFWKPSKVFKWSLNIPMSAISFNRFFARKINSIWYNGSSSKGVLLTFPILFNYVGLLEGRVEVSNYKVGLNPNNDGGEKPQDFDGDVQQNERTYIVF